MTLFIFYCQTHPTSRECYCLSYSLNSLCIQDLKCITSLTEIQSTGKIRSYHTSCSTPPKSCHQSQKKIQTSTSVPNMIWSLTTLTIQLQTVWPCCCSKVLSLFLCLSLAPPLLVNSLLQALLLTAPSSILSLPIHHLLKDDFCNHQM